MKNLFKSIAELVSGGAEITTEVQAIALENGLENETSDEESASEGLEITALDTAAAAAENVLGNEHPVIGVVLADVQVAIDAAELEAIRANAAQWEDNKAELATLRGWKAAADHSSGIVDASGIDADQSGIAPKKKSYLQEIADKRSKTGQR